MSTSQNAGPIQHAGHPAKNGLRASELRPAAFVSDKAPPSKDHVVTVNKETKVLNSKGDALKEGLKDKHLKEGAEVVINCEKKDGKEVASEVKLAGKKK